MPKTDPKLMVTSFPDFDAEFTRSRLEESCGAVPARYSCKLFNPSPSGSHVAQELAFVVVAEPNCVARHESEMPSPTESGANAIWAAPPRWLNFTFKKPPLS